MNKVVDITLKRAQGIAAGPDRSEPQAESPARPFAELMATSNFSFLRSGSDPEELIAYAVAEGLTGLGLCDRNSFAGVVRAYSTLKQLRADETTGSRAKAFRYVVGVRLVFADGTPDIIAYPTDRAAYGRLCQLLTLGNTREVDGKRAQKGVCTLRFEDLAAFAEGQLFLLDVDERNWDKSRNTLLALKKLAGDRLWVVAACRFKGDDRARLNRLAALAGEAGVPIVASNDVLYHIPERRMLQDVVTCIREHITIFEAGRRLEQNAERHIKGPQEMTRLFREHPGALDETLGILKRIGFSLDQLSYSYPTETLENDEPAQEKLERLTWDGAAQRYPGGVSDDIKKGLWSELCLIAYKGYAAYFLTVHDIVRHARDELHIL
jgi:error-prone DNA polymerase